jgi:hypothetical protein
MESPPAGSASTALPAARRIKRFPLVFGLPNDKLEFVEDELQATVFEHDDRVRSVKLLRCRLGEGLNRQMGFDVRLSARVRVGFREVLFLPRFQRWQLFENVSDSGPSIVNRTKPVPRRPSRADRRTLADARKGSL